MKWLVNEYHEFHARGIKILALSCDSISSHIKWIKSTSDCLISPKVSKEVIGHKFPSSTVIDLPSGQVMLSVKPSQGRHKGEGNQGSCPGPGGFKILIKAPQF
uniref:Uncharacterized protein n=1 Tax=Sipha flava TaxID=143950 RepID=A0A2S2R288_9HEMI